MIIMIDECIYVDKYTYTKPGVSTYPLANFISWNSKIS
jgi:hypothetical protein